MIRKARIILAILLGALITFYFLDFANVLPTKFHLLAKIQIVPALLSLSAIVLTTLIVLTLIAGRIYCSVICPLGVFQDVMSRIPSFSKKKKKYSYSKAKTLLRWTILFICILAFLCGISFIIGFLDPYSAYGRMITNVFKPIYMSLNNLMANLFSRYENYTFYQVDVSIRSLISLVIGIVTFLLIGFLAWKNGRTWCNTVCPVGTLLGALSRFSIFKIRIDAQKCNHCGLCATKCKASCINPSDHTIDYSRCVDCFNCLDTCRQGAIHYSLKRNVIHKQEKEEASKRRFLMASLALSVAAPKSLIHAQSKLLNNKKAYKKQNPLTPPGSISLEHFQEHCTSCHLCVSKCPSHVLKPAFMEYGLEGIMQPTVDFEKGFCNFDCTICGEVCPAEAIKPLSIKQKHLTQMGYVVFIKENCIVYTDHTSCGACSEHCPTQAIAMVDYQDGLTIPHVNKDICVGCGGCEYVCPATPYKAVHIEGNPVQIEAKPFKEEKKEKVEIDSFGF